MFSIQNSLTKINLTEEAMLGDKDVVGMIKVNLETLNSTLD